MQVYTVFEQAQIQAKSEDPKLDPVVRDALKKLATEKGYTLEDWKRERSLLDPTNKKEIARMNRYIRELEAGPAKAGRRKTRRKSNKNGL